MAQIPPWPVHRHPLVIATKAVIAISTVLALWFVFYVVPSKTRGTTATIADNEIVVILKEIVAVQQRRLDEYKALHIKKLASSDEVAAAQLDLLNARLKLAYERAKP